MRIIGICGLIGSGKDTVAQYLVDSREYKRLSMATALKDAVSVLFGWDREMLEGRTKASREAREELDQFWSERLGIPWSPRIALQYLGTDLFRNKLHPDVWVIAAERKILLEDKVVFSDIRFPNEIAMLKKLGGEIWRVKRGTDPDWFIAARTYDREYMSEHFPHIHPSEWEWAKTEFDFVAENDASLADLYHKIEERMKYE